MLIKSAFSHFHLHQRAFFGNSTNASLIRSRKTYKIKWIIEGGDI